ncbi:hypothetical protein J28TS4_31120 [Paenibacillus lautus]|nr:hypothetical protein J28TS4_31120 [Paenibacillus lautus]
MQSDLLLILKRAHGGDFLEVMMKRRRAHIDGCGQFGDVQGLIIITLNQLGSRRDALRMTAADGKLLQGLPLLGLSRSWPTAFPMIRPDKS